MTTKPRIICGEALSAMRRMQAETVDAIVTDPPYGLRFMGKKWDYDVPAVEIWREALRVLKPGGHLLAFAGSRTQHRMAVNIEDAGFDLRDCLMWVYGSGFPKSLNVAKQSPELAHMEGWGTALKPAYEPIILARKPLAGTVAENVLQHGTGAINIDGCRICTEETLRSGSGRIPCRHDEKHSRGRDGEASADRRYTSSGGTNFAAKPGIRGGDPAGRWPANFCHDGSDEVLAAFPQAPGQIARARTDGVPQANNTYGALAHITNNPEPRGDAGSAARFFYCAKASKADRDDGLSHLRPRTAGECVDREEGAAALNCPRTGAGRTGGARNFHPTVKPTELMRWLCRMVTPPGGAVLDPFMGSGSTGKAAVLEGFRFVGCEMDSEYCQIAAGRIAYAIKQAWPSGGLFERDSVEVRA